MLSRDSDPGPHALFGGSIEILETWKLYCLGFKVSQNLGYHFGDPHSKDYNLLISLQGPPYLSKGFKVSLRQQCKRPQPGLGFGV